MEEQKQPQPDLSKEDWQQVIQLMGNGPLQNMQHAAQVDQLIIRVMRHAGLIPADPIKKEPQHQPGAVKK